MTERVALPDWPRMMTKARAAAYCDLGAAEFDREVAAGTLPSALPFGRSPHWSRKALDEALDKLENGGAHDWRSTSSFYRKRNAA